MSFSDWMPGAAKRKRRRRAKLVDLALGVVGRRLARFQTRFDRPDAVNSMKQSIKGMMEGEKERIGFDPLTVVITIAIMFVPLVIEMLRERFTGSVENRLRSFNRVRREVPVIMGKVNRREQLIVIASELNSGSPELLADFSVKGFDANDLKVLAAMLLLLAELWDKFD